VDLDPDMRVEPPDRIHGALHLEPADIGRPMNHLPLQVREAYCIIVHDADGADPGCREVLDHGRAQATGTDHEDASGFQLLLPRASNVPQDEVAGIAVDFVLT
jgi:hypothetical protein